MIDLDLNKRYPNYFNKLVFRTAVIVMVVIFFYVLFLNEFIFKQQVNVECKSDQPCLNKFYICNHQEEFMNDNCKLINTTDISFWNCMQNQTYINNNYLNLDCKYIKSLGCDYGICDNEYLKPHEFVGKPKSQVMNMFPIIVILILMISFAANHLLYKWRKNNDKF